MLPELLEQTINSLSRNHNLHSWKLVCGEKNTLVIHWDNDGSHNNSGDFCYSNSNYKRKTPSQTRRDKRRSDNWKAWNTSDSGYKSTPGQYFDKQNNVSVDKECFANQSPVPCIPESEESLATDPNSQKQSTMDRFHIITENTNKKSTQAHVHKSDVSTPSNQAVQSVNEQLADMETGSDSESHTSTHDVDAINREVDTDDDLYCKYCKIDFKTLCAGNPEVLSEIFECRQCWLCHLCKTCCKLFDYYCAICISRTMKPTMVAITEKT